MARIKIIGELDLKREQDRRVYDNTGLAPCLRAENHDVKIFDVKTKFLGRYGYDKTRQDKTRHYLTKSTHVKTLYLHFSHVSILRLCHVCIFHAIRLIISTSRRMRESRTLSTDWRSAHIFTNCFINFATLQRVKTYG